MSTSKSHFPTFEGAAKNKPNLLSSAAQGMSNLPDLIPVVPGKAYEVSASAINPSQTPIGLTFYDIHRMEIPHSSEHVGPLVTAPKNAAYARFGFVAPSATETVHIRGASVRSV